ncbi:ABC transporter ATP-binding protein [Pyxidicoccus fallax]|uniref:ABC transporter ATP-binding protein n=1 Tax=Pyxidicoccus fallax TaxID=394095 RepID=A0A848LQV6_9BACT|nr:ABC transporter ATP-binding protein [Pyxidicoccus fallax]NMO20285.1 ABC transporter ATP-binding protein [Pyxidicoccus fallax]NPC81030.1 ABC transporter ATP-binding protein [Pyxidicoccus fallax]
MSSIAVELKTVSRHYGAVKAVDGVSLSIQDGEFFSMLGPSGSGKTTCLRLIAGFEQPTSGSLLLHGQEAAGLPPYERDVNTVFQDYALFPHMSVLDNVAYGLMVKGVAKATRHKEAETALELVALGGFGSRRPSQLSGGQRQRVALARALINKPRVLLLDEPLGALDLKLREQMQAELKSLQRRLGITFVYVTHDQGEALSMSDRVAVFSQGRIEQVDTPRNLYTRPKTVFVAGFVGTANVVSGELARRLTGSERPFSVRPEHMRFAMSAEGNRVSVEGRLVEVQYHGASSRYEVRVEGNQVLTLSMLNGEADEASLPRRGDTVRVAWAPEAMVQLESGG